MNPLAMDRWAFIAAFGDIFEHSPWVAERAFDTGLPGDVNTPEGLHRAMVAAMRLGSEAEKLALIRAHPDLAGKLAAARQLTADSAAEQASARLDALTDEERAHFTSLNDAYRARFGFPFILAVKGRTKRDIMEAFKRRLAHDRQTEFDTALSQIETIALLRLHARLGVA